MIRKIFLLISSISLRGRPLVFYRQNNAKGRPALLDRIDLYVPLMLLHDAVRHRESQPRPFPYPLGGEKGIEDPGQDFLGNAPPGVRELNDDLIVIR